MYIIDLYFNNTKMEKKTFPQNDFEENIFRLSIYFCDEECIIQDVPSPRRNYVETREMEKFLS